MKSTAHLGLLLILLTLAGCATSNLDSRPDWAKNPKLPLDHPLVERYPEKEYISLVTFRNGRDVVTAKANLRAGAVAEFSNIIFSHVQSEFSTRSDNRGRRTTGQADWASVQNSVQSFVKVSSRQILSGMEEVLSWEGYDGKQKYCYGCFVLSKSKTKRVILKMASSRRQQLEAIMERLGSPDLAVAEAERMALDALKIIMEYRVLFLQMQYFDRFEPLASIARLEQECITKVFGAGRRREQAGTENDLEEALKFYQEAAKYSPDTLLGAKILNVKKRLPCLTCGRGGKCLVCQGAKGKWMVCGACNGSLRRDVRCPTCRGDGKRECGRCNGRKALNARCTACQNGSAACPSCNGKGRYPARCKKCNGQGRVKCTALYCNNGRVRLGPGQYKRCTRCNGRGHQACRTCNGKGGTVLECKRHYFSDFETRSPNCNGTGRARCNDCRGRGWVKIPCDLCQATGRIGTCSGCQGQGQVNVACNQCRQGQVWASCRNCKGKGLCPGCNGMARRL